MQATEPGGVVYVRDGVGSHQGEVALLVYETVREITARTMPSTQSRSDEVGAFAEEGAVCGVHTDKPTDLPVGGSGAPLRPP